MRLCINYQDWEEIVTGREFGGNKRLDTAAMLADTLDWMAGVKIIGIFDISVKSNPACVQLVCTMKITYVYICVYL
mgnify:CR=1 FL=1